MQVIDDTAIGALTERDDDDIPENSNAWVLDDFADVLFWINRSARFPLNHGEEPYPS
jgi:hypothetical protein